MLSDGLVSWRLKQQSFFAQSSKETEFIPLSVCVEAVLWLCKFAGFLKMVLAGEVVDKLLNILTGENNMVYIPDAYNPTIPELSKHEDVKY